MGGAAVVDGTGVVGADVDGADVDGAGVEGVGVEGAGVGASVHAPMLPQSSCGLRLSFTSPSMMAGI